MTMKTFNVTQAIVMLFGIILFDNTIIDCNAFSFSAISTTSSNIRGGNLVNMALLLSLSPSSRNHYHAEKRRRFFIPKSALWVHDKTYPMDDDKVILSNPPLALQRHLRKFLLTIFATASVLVGTSIGVVAPIATSKTQNESVLLTNNVVAWAFSSPEQMLVDDVWKEVTKQFVDTTYGGQGEEVWKRQRQIALEKVAELGPDDQTKVYSVIRSMLATLNDPYTRFLTPEQFESLTTTYTSKSSSQSTSGIGVQLIGDNSITRNGNNNADAGHVIVANVISKSPAEQIGIQNGDIIIKIDGIDMVGATAESVAAKCRGPIGSQVKIEIENADTHQRQTLTATRKELPTTPIIETSTVVINPTPKGDVLTPQSVGIIKINSFTQETASKVQEALAALLATKSKSTSADTTIASIILDLRGNVGGYMPAGVDVAKLFLPPKTRIISEVDKTGRATIYINDGVGSETKLPLYVIVDNKTASASEILTAALQDNHRATIVGETKTFGKGRIQNVQALSSGSGIAITKAKYLSPDGRDIHNVGIEPDVHAKTCSAKDSAIACLDGVL